MSRPKRPKPTGYTSAEAAEKLGIPQRTFQARAYAAALGRDVSHGVHRPRYRFSDADLAILSVAPRIGRPPAEKVAMQETPR